MSILLFVVTTGLLTAAAGFVTASLRLRSFIAFVLATYLLVWAEIVVLAALLSPVHLFLRTALTIGVVLMSAAGLILWQLAGRPAVPSPRAAGDALLLALRDPLLATFLGAVALGFGYLVALALFTPANSWDAMWVWLARAAFWKQEHAVGYVDDVVVLNAYPPVASIADAFSMIVARTDRFVTLGALGAYSASTVSVFGIARRLRLEMKAALFGALMFATLPVVVLQASGALIDLPVACFLTICVYFALGNQPAELALAGAAFALAVGAKLTALLAAPVLILVVVLARPWRWRQLAVAGLASGAIGSAWYILNLVKTGSPGGDLRGHLVQRDYLQSTDHGLLPTVARGLRLLTDFVEVPGAVGWWTIAYVVGGTLAALLVVLDGRLRSRFRTAPVLAAAAAVSPLVVLAFAHLANRAFAWLFFHIGRPDLGIMDQDRGVAGASALASFFGPLGVFLVLSVLWVVVLVARRLLPRVAVAFAAAPLVFLAIVAGALSYSTFWGRLFVFPIALAAAVSGVVMRSRALAWGLAVAASVSLGLTLRANDEKPPEAWGKPRWWVQTRVGPGRDNGERQVIRFAAETVPAHAHLGLSIDDRDWSYPFFGPRLERTIRFVRSAGALPRDLTWLVVGPAHDAPRAGWRRVFRTSDGWAVFTRRT